MFEGLKKRLSNFMDSVVSKEKAEIKEAQEPAHNEDKPTAVSVPTHAHQVSADHATHTQKEEPEPPVPAVTTARAEEHRHRTNETAKAGVGAAAKIKGIIFGSVKLKENDIEPFMEALKLGLLESDVNYEVAEKLSENIKRDMLSRSISSKDLNSAVKSIIRNSIKGVLSKQKSTDILKMIKSKKESKETPFKMLFLGPNGAGKTTTIAKMAHMLMENGFTCVISASDTFRAAAIEQTSFHADKLGVKAIKGAYGADPASIAFDAIAHAKAHGIDAVLIDSAGRQETNKNLLEELKKISRIAKPDMKIFIGESISGNSLLDQVKVLNDAVKIDGIILTKLDCDAKGGNTLSLLSELDIPVLFFGIGERYNDIIPYDPDFIIENILPMN